VLHGETGLLVDPDDPEALARAMLSLLADPERCREMGEAGRRRVEQYRADRIAGSFLAAVQGALGDPRQSRRLADRTLDVSPASGERQASRAGAGGAR
jgi:hypothetical protein